MNKRQIVLVTGASGLVGSKLSQLLSKDFEVLAPSRNELDITKRTLATDYIRRIHPDVIIHAAAFTDVEKAERQRENKHAQCWLVNVEGTRNIREAADKTHAFHIFISTGSVFAGTRDNPGPFTEDDEPPSDSSKLSWYGWTKRMAEKVLRSRIPLRGKVTGAIIRISHPVKKDGPRVERDYIHNLLNLYQKGRLYPLFTDQFFPITWIDDLAQVIEKLIESPRRGVYHVASPDFVSPYKLMQYAVSSRPGLERGAINPLRFTQYCAIDSRKTQELFGVEFQSWRDIVDTVL